jgi:hypothetical protein
MALCVNSLGVLDIWFMPWLMVDVQVAIAVLRSTIPDVVLICSRSSIRVMSYLIIIPCNGFPSVCCFFCSSSSLFLLQVLYVLVNRLLQALLKPTMQASSELSLKF